MSMPNWAVGGEPAMCIDDEWKNTFDIPCEGPFPVKNQIYVIAGTHELLGVGYLILADQSVAPDHYGVSGFRPLTKQEREAWTLERRDRRAFLELLKDAVASEPAPVLERLT